MRGSAHTRRAAALAAAQHGNVTFDQLKAAGLSAGQIQDRIDIGWLIPRHREVYAVGHKPRSLASRFMAAVLAHGEDATLSHRAAGALWQIVRGAVPLEVTTPDTGRRKRDGILIHRCALPPEHVDTIDGIRVTTLVRTLLDLAAVLPLGALAKAFEEAQVKHHLSPTALAVEVLSRRGYRGTAKLKRILKDAVDPTAVRSVLELRFLELCEAYAIPRPLVNEKLGPWIPDFYWPEFGLVVETDGYAFHRTATQRRKDASKDEYLRALGLTVIRLTWADVTEQPSATAALIAGALRETARV